MQKLILPAAVIAILVILGFVLFKNSPIENTFSASGKTHIIILTENGFEPENIEINAGDTIVFKTTSGKHFWPASDIHPTHGIYPEFDPQDAVAPDKTWSFKFEKTGTFRYHDHLAPYFTGRIIVE